MQRVLFYTLTCLAGAEKDFDSTLPVKFLYKKQGSHHRFHGLHGLREKISAIRG